MKKVLIVIMIIILLALGGGVGYYFFGYKKNHNQSEAAKNDKTNDKANDKSNDLQKDVTLSREIISVDGFVMNIVQDGQIVGKAFVTFLVVMKNKNTYNLLKARNFLLRDALLLKFSDFLAVADVKKPILFSKVRDVITSAVETLIPKKDIGEVVVESFYVRLLDANKN